MIPNKKVPVDGSNGNITVFYLFQFQNKFEKLRPQFLDF